MLPQNRSPHLKEKLRIFEDISRSSRPGSRPLRSVSTSGSCSTRAEGVRQVLSRFRSATARSQQEPQKRFQAAVLDKEEQIKKLKRVLKHRDEIVRELQDTMTKKEEDACYLLNEKLKLCHDLLTKRTDTYDLQLQLVEDARGCAGACGALFGDKLLEKGSEISTSKAQAKQKIEGLQASARTPCKWKTLSALNGETVAEVFFEVLLGQMETRIESVLNEAVSSVLDLPDQFSKTIEAYNEIKTMQEEIRSLRLENESLRRSLKRTPFQMHRPSEGEASVTVQRQPEGMLQNEDTVLRICTGIKEASASLANREATCRRSADAGAVKVGMPTSEQESYTRLQYLNSCNISNAKDVQGTLTEETYSITEREQEVTTESRYSVVDEDALENAELVAAEKEPIGRLKEEVKRLSQKCRYLEALDTMTWRRIQQRMEHDNRARLRLKARYLGAYAVLKTKLHKTQKRRGGCERSPSVEPCLASPICLQ
eukprot:XP_028343301.1 uncharacterized protein LOC114485700 [Physeter catodon]